MMQPKHRDAPAALGEEFKGRITEAHAMTDTAVLDSQESSQCFKLVRSAQLQRHLVVERTPACDTALVHLDAHDEIPQVVERRLARVLSLTVQN